MSEALNTNFKSVLSKRVFYDSIDREGNSILLCTPQSKYHESISAWWIDITQIQYELLEKYDKAVVVFRLQGSKLCTINWDDLKPYLIDNCMKYNEREKEHWKLYIYKDHIQIVGNDSLLTVQVLGYTE